MRSRIRVKPGALWGTALFETDEGSVTLRGFPRAQLAQLIRSVNSDLEEYTQRRLRPRFSALCEAASQIERLTSGQQYARHSQRLGLVDAAICAVEVEEDPFWSSHAGPPELRAAELAHEFIENSEVMATEANKRFLKAEPVKYKQLFDTIESRPLTTAQRRACIIGEDNNLVLAGAGTGKTSTMIGRAGYLVASGQAGPDEILMLAYAKKAAGEMQEREEERLRAFVGDRTPAIKTFHALGLQIIGTVEGTRPELSPMAEDSFVLQRFIDDQLDECQQNAEYKAKVVRYFRSEAFPYRNPFDFGSMDEYREYVRCNELRTLKGEAVKSFEECIIANFLSAHSIRYEYERAYEVDTSGPDYRRYKPDFFLPDLGIYIEHFALDASGRPPEHFESKGQKYLKGIEWKRELHQTNETTLIETYSYLKREGRLESFLAESLQNAGAELVRRSDDDLLEELRGASVISEFSSFLGSFLTLFRQSDLTIEDLRTRFRDDIDSSRLLLLLDLCEPVLGGYEEHLAQNREIDFADMIKRATRYVESARYRSPFTHILVDEFQDISGPRAGLITALVRQRPDSVLFVVGDDWQAIYRFAGSDISYVRDFQQVFGATATVALDTTFRFNDRLGTIASDFVLKNPEQIRKTISSLAHQEEPAVSIVGVSHEALGLSLALEAIHKRAEALPAGRATVLVLARYHFVHEEHTKGDFKKSRLRARFPLLDVQFLTVHAAKGKEADFVVVLGLSEGKYGFPCEKPSDMLLEYLLPEREDFSHAEERRLFYVALTRARHRVYLIYNPLSASAFVTELLEAKEQLPVSTDEFKGRGVVEESARIPCPSCPGGALVMRTGQYGLFVGCSHYPYCRHKERPCVRCGSLMRRDDGWRVCANPDCDEEERVCPVCGGSMIERTGPYGQFLGCSNYRRGSDFLCTHTENLARACLSRQGSVDRQALRG
jgi:DNA helicase-4